MALATQRVVSRPARQAMSAMSRSESPPLKDEGMHLHFPSLGATALASAGAVAAAAGGPENQISQEVLSLAISLAAGATSGEMLSNYMRWQIGYSDASRCFTSISGALMSLVTGPTYQVIREPIIPDGSMAVPKVKKYSSTDLSLN